MSWLLVQNKTTRVQTNQNAESLLGLHDLQDMRAKSAVGLARHFFFKSAVQFTTSAMGSGLACPRLFSRIR